MPSAAPSVYMRTSCEYHRLKGEIATSNAASRPTRGPNSRVPSQCGQGHQQQPEKEGGEGHRPVTAARQPRPTVEQQVVAGRVDVAGGVGDQVGQALARQVDADRLVVPQALGAQAVEAQGKGQEHDAPPTPSGASSARDSEARHGTRGTRGASTGRDRPARPGRASPSAGADRWTGRCCPPGPRPRPGRPPGPPLRQSATGARSR